MPGRLARTLLTNLPAAHPPSYRKTNSWKIRDSEAVRTLCVRVRMYALCLRFVCKLICKWFALCHTWGMEANSVFRFRDPVEYMSACLQSRRAQNPRYSLRAWSRQLGFKNPALLSQILNGKRTLGPAVAELVVANLQLKSSEKRYFELLVLLGKAKTQSEKEIYCRSLERLRKGEEFHSLGLDLFRLMADWYHLALLEMVELRDFREDSTFLARRLREQVPSVGIEKALARLLRLGLLVRVNGRIRRSRAAWLKVGANIPSDAIRKFHRQMIDKAQAALDEMPVKSRDVRGSTLSLRHSQRDQALQVIERAHAELIRLSARGDGEETFQFNTQFFPLTGKADQEKSQ